MIKNDIEAHESPVEKCKDSVSNVLSTSKITSEKKALEGKLEELVQSWDQIQFLYAERETELMSAFDESRHFQEQTREMLNWLSEANAFLKTKKPIGGKPETARSQLEKHKV